MHTKCSPSRAALLTGRYAWTLGRQRGAIERYQPAGLTTRVSLLPGLLQQVGYQTHAVGKWHLGESPCRSLSRAFRPYICWSCILTSIIAAGYCHPSYLPTRRGFQTFFGMWQQSTDYRTRMVTCSSIKFSRDQIGYDLRRNETVSQDYSNMFSTSMYAKVT